MNIYVTILLTSSIAALATAVFWLILRRFSQTTKSAWSLAIAIGYGVGHVGYLAATAIASTAAPGESAGLVGDITHWLMVMPHYFSAVVWPTEVINWLPIGVLLAGLVSANSAMFPFDRVITMVGAALVSFWLGIQLMGVYSMPHGNYLTAEYGVRILVGTIAMLLCWLSLQNSIQGKSRKVWMGCVLILTVSVVGVLTLLGSGNLIVFGTILLGAMGGGLGASLLRASGTDNVRFSGAAISCISVSLLLVAWYSNISWYPIVFLFAGFLFVNGWMPSALRGQRKRLSLSVGCSIVSLVLAAMVRFGVL